MDDQYREQFTRMPSNDLWSREFDEFMHTFQTEQPELFFAVNEEANNFNFESPTSPRSDLPTPSPCLDPHDLSLPQQYPDQQPTPSEAPSLQRSNSKRPRGEEEEEHNEDHKGKRNRKIPNGFKCEEEGCDKCFDRACDLNKHRGRVHVAKGERPHQCPKCTQRFCWPKDVKRHLAQVHSSTEHDNNALVIRSGPKAGLRLEVKAEPQDIMVMDSPASPSSKSSPTMAWLTRSLVMLKKLRLRSKSIDEGDGEENSIFVTLDKQDFRLVDVNGVSNVDTLTQRIAKTFEGQRQIQSSNFLLHRFKNSSKLGEQLAGENLMGAITKAKRTKRTLKLFLTVKSGPSKPPTSFFGRGTVTSP